MNKVLQITFVLALRSFSKAVPRKGFAAHFMGEPRPSSSISQSWTETLIILASLSPSASAPRYMCPPEDLNLYILTDTRT